MTGYLLVTVVLLLLAEATGRWIREHRCWYCGILYRHDPGCPYGLLDE